MRTAVSRRWTLADVAYDPATHSSRLPDGTLVPHVTTVLSSVGVTVDFEGLQAKLPKLSEVLIVARARGTATHADCHAHDDGDLNWATVNPIVRPYVEAWAQFRADTKLVPVSRERRIFHPVHLYTGIQDGIFDDTHRGRVLVDIKTGDPWDGAAHLQTSAYREAYQHETGDTVHQRWAVWLRPGLRVPYRVVNYDDQPGRHQMDFHKFLACLAVYREQPGRRRR